MADEEKQKTEQSTDQKPSQPADQGRIAELEGLLSGKTAELAKAGERLAELERTAAEAGDRAGKLDCSFKQAVISYKTLITKANPDVLPEMLTGESIEDLDASLGKARELIGKIKTGLETQNKAARVPAGAPQRGAPDTSSLSPREKIRLGMEKANKAK